MIKQRIHQLLARLERASSDKSSRPLKHAPIFIIGPPRSGSTLLYQTLIARYKLGYVSNLHERFYTNPALAERLLRVSRWPRKTAFESRHGNTEGWTAPSENWRYWYRFFRRHPQFVDIEDADPAQMNELRGSLRALGNAFGRPVLVKNLSVALRLAPLHEALPEAIYLVMRRDWCAMGRSILAARKQVHGSYEDWWSLEPRGFERLRERPAHEQVVEQIRLVYDLIDEARGRYGDDRFLEVGFEEFCAGANGVLDRIADFAARHGVTLDVRGPVPNRFPGSGRSALEVEVEEQLNAYATIQQQEYERRQKVCPQS